MIQALLRTPNDASLLILRVVLGGVMWAHGAQKMLGWFGGHGFQGTIEFFVQRLHIPAPLAVLVILTEFFGMIALALGLFGRVMALGAGAILAVAVALIHHKNGFYMNWYGTQRGEGFELHLLGIAIAIAIVLRGSGAWSIDRLLVRDPRGGRA